MVALYQNHLEYLIFHNPDDRGIPVVETKLALYLNKIK